MESKLYAVVRHEGQWGVSVRGTSFLSCVSFQEALEVAMSAAEILRSTHDTGRDTKPDPLVAGYFEFGG